MTLDANATLRSEVLSRYIILLLPWHKLLELLTAPLGRAEFATVTSVSYTIALYLQALASQNLGFTGLSFRQITSITVGIFGDGPHFKLT